MKLTSITLALTLGVCSAHAAMAGDAESGEGKSELTKKLEDKVPAPEKSGVYLSERPKGSERSEPEEVSDDVSGTFNKHFGKVKDGPGCDRPGVNC